jgi:pimeloyl-ACP methyl ester carboxylesterase
VRIVERVPIRNDVVVLLPGITGSALEKDGKPVWDLSVGAFWTGLTSFGDSLDSLVLEADDAEAEWLDDGVRATGLIRGCHGIPGLMKSIGYGPFSHFLTETFSLTKGSLEDDDDTANYFEFAYDWRRDNRAAAVRLKRLLGEKLDRRRARHPDGKAILLAHSMGGLVCRHYLEVLGGWERCRALISFGTPYRGSPQALEFLVNGHKKLFMDVTEMMRSFTSMYQLLPRYEVIQSGDGFVRPKDIDLPRLEDFRSRATDAFDFHDEIDNRIASRGYRSNLVVQPYVGTRQGTTQSAVLEDGKLRTGETLPSWIDPLHEGGDGTVPLVSAIPIELSDTHLDVFAPGRHASLFDTRETRQALRHRLTRLQARGLEAVRAAPVTAEEETAQPALSLRLDDVYAAGQPAEIAVDVLGMPYDPGHVECVIRDPSTEQSSTFEMTRVDGDRWQTAVADLDAGEYTVTVRTQAPGARPVVDLFWVTR